MEEIKFTAVLEPVDAGGVAVCISKEFLFQLGGGKKRIPVNVDIDGVSYKSTIVTMGNDLFFFPVRKEIRQQISKDIHDEVVVTLSVDLEQRVVDIPDEIMESFLLLPPTLEYFRTLSYTYQKEMVNYVLQAKRIETKNKRILKIIEWIYEMHAKKKNK
ncbi:MAG: DUF1905 domain-containing protein [Bacteroidetes bacterium]|nr:DUF1905 domain-containing protein [Bacteroidota bacterium]